MHHRVEQRVVFDAARDAGPALDASAARCAKFVHLRTTDLEHPWQSYRSIFVTREDRVSCAEWLSSLSDRREV